MADPNENNLTFIKDIFGYDSSDKVHQNYPEYNYRIRLAGFTEYNPYISEYPRLEDETDDNYKARVSTSGKYFGEQEILMNNVVWSEEDINGLQINSTFYDGKIPKTLLFLEECKLEKETLEDGTTRDMYEVRSKCLNDKNKVKSHAPLVTFPADLPESDADEDKKGYLVFRKKDIVTKVNPDVPLGEDAYSLLNITSGWHQVTGLSSNDIKSLAGDSSKDIADRIRAAGFTDTHTEITPPDGGSNYYSGYESFTNELETKYKVIDSGVYKANVDTEDLADNRVIDLKLSSAGSSYYSDGTEADDHARKTYTLERKITRESNSEEYENPSKWEAIEHNARFPYTDDENLSDFIETSVDFEIRGVYSTLEPTGSNSSSDKDFFEVSLLPDWGKAGDQTNVTNRENTDTLSFRSGESIKVIQRSTRKFTTRDNYNQYNSVDLHFSPFSTGQSGCLTGVGNEKNFYQLEYQLIPQKTLPEKLYYQTGESLTVGDEVFLNTGQAGDSTYNPIETDLFGATPDFLGSEQSLAKTKSLGGFSKDTLGSFFVDFNNQLAPEIVPQGDSEETGYSSFASGEKYVITPKGGYTSLAGQQSSPSSYVSAGETTSLFFQGEQSDDLDAHYALTEWRTFDVNPFSDESFLHKDEREIRIGQKSICLGESCTDLTDTFLSNPSYILDPSLRVHRTYTTLTNGRVLNIDSSNGGVDISNLKSNREEFLNKANLFFEKDYVASLTILATGQEQDVNPLASFMERGKKYYIERDIYVDSDVSSQSNSHSPAFRSSEVVTPMNPFSTTPNTPNRLSLGQEKHYLTQVFHSDHDSFPYTDYDFYNSQPTVREQYTYDNSDEVIISDPTVSVDNIASAREFVPGSFACAVSAVDHEAKKDEGYVVLMNTGVHDTWPNGIDVDDFSSDRANISFSGINAGAYYEIQNRDDAGSDWRTVSPAVIAEHEAKTTEKRVLNLANATKSNYRILEWVPSAVLSNYEGVSVANESPDSLILKSTASSNRVYDVSKVEHSVTNLAVTSLADNELIFNGSASLTVGKHRSLNIQNGEFSLEFFLKSLAGNGTIFERSGDVKVYIDTNLKIDFNGANVISHNLGTVGATAKHIAICKHVINRPNATTECFLSLFVDGVLIKEVKDLSYGDYSFRSEKSLVIGSGLTATVSHLRFYVGKSIYPRVEKFTVPDSAFSKEGKPRKYKILKLQYKRQRDKGSNWIINRNSFDNVNPPSDYQLTEAEEPKETTKHTYEWFSINSSDQTNSKNRALVNYLQGYAYRAPNNPHINKNYEGSPIEIKDNEKIDLNALINPETYHYRIKRGATADASFSAPAPYYYEYLGSSDVSKVRRSKKGGEDSETMPLSAQTNNSFKNGSRLRITKYVYKLYTKSAVVVGDTGYKDSRSAQGGWAYQLQYSTDSGSTWADADTTESFEDYVLFQNEDSSYSPTSFENLDHAFILPAVVAKTNITQKYTPDQIKFRVQRKQSLTMSRDSAEVNVFKKFNTLPIEVNIPVSGCLLDLTQKNPADADSKQEGYSKFNDSTDLLEVFLDPAQDYVIQKDNGEKILLSSNPYDELQVYSPTRNDLILTDGGKFKDKEKGELLSEGQLIEIQKTRFADSEEDYSALEDGKPYTLNGLTGIMIYREGASSKADFESVVGVKPSGINLSREEKSYETDHSSSTSYNQREFDTVSGLDVTQTKFFFTPKITGSHFDELQDMGSDGLINFSCKSFVTGNNQETVPTGVAGITFDPIHKFRSDIMVGKFSVDVNDSGKTFLCSGSAASGIISTEGEYDFDIVNVSSDPIKLYNSESDAADASFKTVAATGAEKLSYKGGSVAYGGSTGVITPLPTVVNDDDESYLDVVVVDGISNISLDASKLNKDSLLINTSDSACSVAGTTLGSLSGILFDKNANRATALDSGVVIVDHDEIVLTADDASITGVIDTDSTLVLPSGFSNGQHVTFLNSTNYEAKVISESGYAIDEGGTTEGKMTYYMPKNEAVKFTVSNDGLNSNTKWSASNIEVIKYNQLRIDSGTADKKVFLHDEDVDVRVNTSGMATERSFSVLRSQIDDIDLSDLRSQKTPILRIFINDVLEYSASPGVLGVRIEKSGSNFTFSKIDVIANDKVSISPSSHGKVFCYSGSNDELIFDFEESDAYRNNFEFFVISNKAKFDLSLSFESPSNIYKFNDQEDSNVFGYEVEGMGRDVMLRVSRSKKAEGREISGKNRFFIEAVGLSGLKERSSNIYKTTQEASGKEEIIINRNKGLGLQLPTLGSNYDYSKQFNLLYVNASEENSDIKYPAEAVNEDEGPIFSSFLDSQGSFSSKLYNHKKQEESVSEYQNFIQSDIYKSHQKKLKHGDVAIIDGSLASVNLKSFFSEGAISLNKHSEDNENLVSQITCETDNILTLPNHGLINNQRINFLCDRLTDADYFWNQGLADLISASNTIGGTPLTEGDTVITVELGSYFFYVFEGSDEYSEISFSYPYSESALFVDLSEGLTVPNHGRLFFRVNKGSNVPNVNDPDSGDIFDFGSAPDEIAAGDDLRDSPTVSIASRVTVSFDDDSDDGSNKTQTYFVEVIDDNRFRLYKNRGSDDRLVCESDDFDPDKYFLSDLFYVSDSDCSSVSVINLGDGDESLKTFEEHLPISGDASTLSHPGAADLFNYSDGTYASGDLTHSGVYLATGYNEDNGADNLDIAGLTSKKHVISSGVFHAKGSLTSDPDFDDSYFINSNLEEVVVTNTDDSTLHKIAKNRAYKHTEDGTFKIQSKTTDTTSEHADVDDIIYYPKNEIHIPNRKSLTKAGSERKHDYNFVFIKPVVHNEDLVVILPSDDWSAEDKISKVAVVNMHNRPINVADFNGTVSTPVNANSVLFIEDEGFATTNSYLISDNKANEYAFSSDDDFVKDAKVTKGRAEEQLYVLHEGDIILDYGTHNGKDILIESDINFVGPYLRSTDGATSYLSGDTFKPNSSNYFYFKVVNISTESKQELSYGVGMESGVTYSVQVEAFDTSYGDGIEFRFFKAIYDEQTVEFDYPTTSLDKNFKYHVFGKELSLDLSVYYRSITVTESRRINYMLGLDENTQIGEDEASNYFRIIGVGSGNNSNLTIVNNIYENIKIKSVSLVGDGLSEDEIEEGTTYKQNLQDKILNYFADETSTFDYEELGEDGQTTSLVTTAIGLNYLGKDKVLKISIADLIGEYSSHVFNAEGAPFEQIDEVRYLDVDKSSEVKYLKKENVYFDVEQSSEEANPYFRYILTSPANVYLPSREALTGFTRDAYFVVVNASRESCTLMCPEGTGVLANQSISSDDAIKIKWDQGSGAFSVVSGELSVSALKKALFSCDYGAFMAITPNTSSNPLLIHENASPLKIINNTGSSFHVKHYDYDSDNSKKMDGVETMPVSKFAHTNIEKYSDGFRVSAGNQNSPFTRIRDSVALSKKLYEDKVVFFDAAAIKSFSMSEQSFFNTSFVPLIRVKEFDNFLVRRGSELMRARGFSVRYSVSNSSGASVSVADYRPCIFDASGEPDPITDKICYMFEFVLDSSVNDKIIMTDKHYDYVAKFTENTAYSLFNSDGGEVNIWRLDQNVNNRFVDINGATTDEGMEDLLSSTGLDGEAGRGVLSKAMFSANQANQVYTFTSQQTYTDYIRYTELEDLWTGQDPDPEGFSERYLLKSFYASKNAYKDKIIVFKRPYLISSLKTPSIYNDGIFLNIGGYDCYVDPIYNNTVGIEGGEGDIFKLKKDKGVSSSAAHGSVDVKVNKPKYALSDKTKINVLNHVADAEFSGTVDGFKVVNSSPRVINLTQSGLTDKVYSSERADYDSSVKITYAMCPRSNRKDWFLKLEDVDIVHQERDLDYFNEKEANAEALTQTKGYNVKYKGERYRFSNMFSTNLYQPEKQRSGFESIFTYYNSKYIFGATLYGNTKGEKKHIRYDANFNDYALTGLKLPWDMPSKTIAYSLNTGHERLCYCKEFNERSGLVTFSGVEKNRLYTVDRFDETYYNLVHSAEVTNYKSHGYAAYKYENVKSNKFQPRIRYNGAYYKPGEEFKGIGGVTDYQVEYVYFAQLKANHFISVSEDINDSIEAQKIELEAASDEFKAKVADPDSGVVSPIWSKVPAAGVDRANFKVAKVEAVTTSGNAKELIQGKKLKDIQGVYKEVPVEKETDDSTEEELIPEKYFEFKIAYNSDFTVSSALSDVTWQNEGSEAYKTDGYYLFRVPFGIFDDGDREVDYPGYEYEIQSSFAVTNSKSKDLLTLSLKTEETAPFAADDTIRSLNLDFNTDSGQEALMLEGDTYSSSFSKRVAIAQGSGKITLKNNIGYSFVPFNRYGQNFYGMSFMSTNNKRTYSSLRFRLKKLTDKELIFEDLKEGSDNVNTDKTPIAKYLSKGTSGLKYNLETEVNSMSYHDIARPGGVLKMKYPDWEDVVIDNNNLKVEKSYSNGDAIVFKNDSGSIKAGQPYFIRFATDWSDTAHEQSAEVEVLRIYSNDTSIDSYNKIAYNAGIENNKYKIVNYFTLSKEGSTGHRSRSSILKKLYAYGGEVSPYTSLNYPVVVGPLTLMLEPPLTEVGEDAKYIDTWGNKGYSGDDIRFNLELSTISKHWHGEEISGSSFERGVAVALDGKYIDNVDSHWVNEDIFSSYKNLLYRANTQVDRVSMNWDTDGGGRWLSKIIIKLNKNTNYRYIYKGDNSRNVTKVILNGSEIEAGGGTIYNTNEDLVIYYNGISDVSELYSSINRNSVGDTPNADLEKIYQKLCIVELAEYIDSNPSDDDSSANINKVDYFDYQIPSLNSYESVGLDYTPFKNVYPSYFTESSSGLLSYGEKQGNLVDHDKNGFVGDLFYDMGMPAVCKYIYLDFVNQHLLSFSITNFWDGFENKFDGPNEVYKVKPTELQYDLEESSDGLSWAKVGETTTKADQNFSISPAEEVSSDKKYRMLVRNVKVQYKNPDLGETDILKYTNLSSLRIPFKWTSAIKGSDLSDGVYDDSSGLYRHTLSMPENYLLGKSVSFPREGVVEFGEFNYLRDGVSATGENIKVPCTRLYMVDFIHNLRANYKDAIKRGGISKVIITGRGENYRIEPTIAIKNIKSKDAAPEGGTQATASAIIEAGKLKHIEIENSGTGYADLTKNKRDRRISVSKYSISPLIYHTLEITNSAERRLDYETPIEALKAQSGLDIFDVGITGNESSLPDEVQEEFGLTFDQTEKIDEYERGHAELTKAKKAAGVNLIKGTPGSDDWGFIDDVAKIIAQRANASQGIIDQVNEATNYGTEFVEEDSVGSESDSVAGLYEEDERDTSSISNRKSSVQFDGNGEAIQFEVYPSVTDGSAIAIANNTSIADYRVIDNEAAAKTNPWLNAFSRSDNPTLPKSFGMIPGSNISSEVFNSYAKALNYLSKVRVEAPIYAKIRRFKKVEWRHISNPRMAGLTFKTDGYGPSEGETVNSGDQTWGNGFYSHAPGDDYFTYKDDLSRVNYIVYVDQSDPTKPKIAHFSGFREDGSGVVGDGENIVDYDIDNDRESPIWDMYEEALTADGKQIKNRSGRRCFKAVGNDSPKEVGFPNIVNIPESLGVYCAPKIRRQKGKIAAAKDEGVPLPTPVQKRAFAYGGDLIHSSPVYDVSDETMPFDLSNSEVGSDWYEAVEGSSLVDIRGSSNYIKAGYQNQIVFGCQANGMPFWSAFLRTEIVWTEYEIVSSPEFTKNLPAGIRDRYKPEETKIRCELVSKRITCSNDVIGKVDKSSGYHSICSNGGKSYNIQHSYEDAFGLSNGDDVVGPKESVNEISELIQAPGKGTFKVDPEFDLSLAVYAANEVIKAVRGRGTYHNSNDYIGPCIHYCVPGQVKSLKIMNDPLTFDMKK